MSNQGNEEVLLTGKALFLCFFSLPLFYALCIL